MGVVANKQPDWDQLFETAAAQEGLFTTQQAANAGYSPQLLLHHVKGGRIRRLHRGIYRLVHFPAGDHEDLSLVWLWSDRKGVFSHETALALHDLSDALPAQVHLTLPKSWSSRRLRVPDGVVLHFGDVAKAERRWIGPVPATSPARTLIDCAEDTLPDDILYAAVREAMERGLLSTDEMAELREIAGAAIADFLIR